MKYKIGDRVINLRRFEATVVGFHKTTGDLILEDKDGLRWLAIRKQCEKLKEPGSNEPQALREYQRES